MVMVIQVNGRKIIWRRKCLNITTGMQGRGMPAGITYEEKEREGA